MKDKEKVILISILILIIATAMGLRFVTAVEDDDESELPKGVNQYLNGHEFTDICLAWDKVFCSGVDGLFVIDPMTEEAHIIESKLRFVRALEYDAKRDVLWVGHSEGVAIYDGKSFTSLDYVEGLKDTVNDILISSDGTIYIGTFSGLFVIGDQTIINRYTTDTGLLDNMVNRLLEDNDHNIWFGSYVAKGGGIGYIKDGQVNQSFQIEDGLIHNAITSLALINQSQILVGGGVYTSGGANELSFDSIEWTISDVILKEDGLAGEKVRHIYIDSECNRWFCSEYDGIAVFNDDYTPITLITRAQGLSDNEVKKITADAAGNLWMATRSGVTKFDFVMTTSLIK